jgi:hypothetical protein
MYSVPPGAIVRVPAKNNMPIERHWQHGLEAVAFEVVPESDLVADQAKLMVPRFRFKSSKIRHVKSENFVRRHDGARRTKRHDRQ